MQKNQKESRRPDEKETAVQPHKKWGQGAGNLYLSRGFLKGWGFLKVRHFENLSGI